MDEIGIKCANCKNEFMTTVEWLMENEANPLCEACKSLMDAYNDPVPTKERFEYGQVLSMNEVNNLGKDGWKLTHVSQGVTGFIYILERRYYE